MFHSHIDAQRAFERAAREHVKNRLLRRRVDLDVHEAPLRSRPANHVSEIPLDAISGTLEPGRARQFDRAFRPRRGVSRARWERLWMADQRGEILPPIEVVQVGCAYAVIDGHHRVSVARARGAVAIDAVIAI
jgi:hypothetical protein